MQMQPAFTLALGELAALFNAAFDGYIGGQVSFTEAALASFIAHETSIWRSVRSSPAPISRSALA